MEKELDLTLRLGLPIPTVETHLSLQLTHPTTQDQGLGVEGGCQVNNGGGANNGRRRRGIFGGQMDVNDEGASNDVNVNIRVYNSAFQLFAGLGNTLNFAPHPMQPYAPPPPREIPTRRDDYVLIDVPARRAYNNYLATANASAVAAANQTAAANANARGTRGNCRETIVTRKCTNRNCNAQDTPMWRRGPLGPKSLCNACGIKFRKEQERRARRNNGV